MADMTDQDTPAPRAASPIATAILVLVALLLPCFFNIFIFHEMQSFALSSLSYLSSAALTLFILTLSCRIRTVGFIVLPVLCLFTFLTCFVYRQYGILISQDVVSSIIETDPREAAPFITFRNICLLVLPLLVMAAGILAGHKFVSKKSSNILLITSLALFGILAAVCRPISKNWQRANSPDEHTTPHVVRCLSKGMYWPLWQVQFVYKMANTHFKEASHLCHEIMRLPSGYEPPAEGDTTVDDMVVVMMLGESVRADHLQINGYERETTPLLAARGGQVVSFPHTCSFGLFTRVSVVGVLTDAEIVERTVHHKPFIDILKQDGYTTSYMMLQEEGVADSQMQLLLQDCDRSYIVDPRIVTEGHARIETCNTFDKALKETGDAPKAFYFLYDSGAHAPYERVAANRVFSPDDLSGLPAENPVHKIVNAYDNCLREIDWEVDTIIRKLEATHRPAVFVFCSDHGEALGENGIYTHGAAVPQVYTPAIFIWCSEEFIAKYPERYAALKANAAKAVSHDHIMHTVLSLAGYRRGAYKAELDLTTPEAKETPVPADQEVLFQMVCGEESSNARK